MTEEQRRDRMRVITRNGPIKIYRGKDPGCPICRSLGKFCEKCWFQFTVMRAAGREHEFRLFHERYYWFFWHQHACPIMDDMFSLPYQSLYTFRTFREACNKVKEIFSDGVRK